MYNMDKTEGTAALVLYRSGEQVIAMATFDGEMCSGVGTDVLEAIEDLFGTAFPTRVLTFGPNALSGLPDRDSLPELPEGNLH